MSLSNVAFREAYAKVPEPIREFLVGEELTDATSAIGQHYALHIDRVGELVDVITETLLGFIQPLSLADELFKRVGIRREDSAAVIAEINEKIFIPLQRKVKEDSIKPKEEPLIRASSAPAMTQRPATQSLSDQRPAPPSYHPEILAIKEPLPSHASSTPSVQPTSAPVVLKPFSTSTPQDLPPFQKQVPPPTNLPGVAPPLQPIYPSYKAVSRAPDQMLQPAVPATVSGTMRTMQSDMLAVNEHKKPVALAYTPSIPTQPAPATPLPPQSPVQTASPTPVRPSITTPHAGELVKEYSVDPYREPVA